MKIRMKVEASGADGMLQPGDEVEVGAATGQELVEAGLAETVEAEEPVEDGAGEEAEVVPDEEETAPEEEETGEAEAE